ncbi:unnamed protein product [Closterium sp. NIES-54]
MRTPGAAEGAAAAQRAGGGVAAGAEGHGHSGHWGPPCSLPPASCPPPPTPLPLPFQQERLRALQQHSGLGEGYLLAQRDMDIRGIGDVFGERQSGDVGGVGYYLFMEMLHETLTRVEQKSLPRVQFKEVRLDLPLAPLPPIPAAYVSDGAVRVSLPREAEEAAAEGMPALLAFCREMRAEYGDEPAAVELLFKHLFVRRMAADLGIYRILQREQGTTIVMETAMKLPAFEILRDAVQQKVMREGLSFRSGRIEQQMQAVGQRGPSSTMVATTRKLLQEGGVRALYRGVEPAVVRALSYGCLRLGLYEPCRNMIAPKDKSQVHMGHKALAGIMSGSFATAVSNPLDVAKVRLQMISETAAGSSAASAAVKSAGARSSRSTSGQILEIARTEGVGALWKGVGPSMGRAAALTAAQCAVYDECKQMLKARAGVSDGLPLHLSASMLAGAVSTLASSPFDTVKTRMMAVKKTSAAASASSASSTASAAPRAPLPPPSASPSIPPQSNATISGASSAFSPVNLQNPAPHNSSAQLQPALAYSTSSASPAPSARPPPLPAARGLPPLGPAPAAAPVAGAAPPAGGGAIVYRGSMHCAYSPGGEERGKCAGGGGGVTEEELNVLQL